MGALVRSVEWLALGPSERAPGRVNANYLWFVDRKSFGQVVCWLRMASDAENAVDGDGGE